MRRVKKFAFTLQKLLEYKNQVLDDEKGKLKALRQKRDEIESRIAEYEREFAETDRQLKEEQRTGMKAPRLLLYDYQLESIRRQIKQLREELALAEVEVEKQIQVVVAASQEVSGLDKLEEKQLEQYQKEVAKENELVISEFVSSSIIRGAQENS